MGNFYMESTQINYRRDEKLKTVDQKLQELSETSAIDTDIAPVFKSTNTYQPGDMVYYRNKLYVFNVEHTGAWAAADVTATDVTTQMSSLKSGLTNVYNNAFMYIPSNPNSDGQHYYIDLSGYNFRNMRTGVMVLKGSLSTGLEIVKGTYYTNTFMFDSDSNVTYDATNKRLVIDEGANAWYLPYLVIPSMIIST